MKKIAITSMYANPLHPGHVECLELSKELADELWVIVNNDHQAKLKRGTESFQDEQFRMRVVKALKPVDRVILAVDVDGSVCETLEDVIKEAKEEFGEVELIFTKGGDRFADEIPERKVLDAHGVKIVDGLGKKTHSSSSYVKRVANPADEQALTKALELVPEAERQQEYIEVGVRPWGVYYVLEDHPSFKVKKIVVTPGQRLSLQSHQHRSEHWVVVSGEALVEIRDKKHPANIGHRIMCANESCYVPQGHVHRLANQHKEPLIIIEVQTGSYMGEDDIERYDDDYDRIAS